MSKSWIALLALVLATPAFAQEEPAAEEPAEASEEAPAEEAVTEEAPAEEAPAEEAAAEGAAAEEAPAEAASEEEVAGEAAPWKLYVGADTVDTTLSRSAPPSAAASDFDSGMLRLRAGTRILDGIDFELHYGLDQADEAAGEVATDAYYGAFIVPTATLSERFALELAFPVGYARSEFGDGGDALGSVAYGASLEQSIRWIREGLPDLRIAVGGMVYYQKGDGRVYGLNAGLRYNFSF